MIRMPSDDPKAPFFGRVVGVDAAADSVVPIRATRRP